MFADSNHFLVIHMLWFTFLPFFKMGDMFLFFKSLGTPPNCQDFSNMMEHSLETTPARSIKALDLRIATAQLGLYEVS